MIPYSDQELSTIQGDNDYLLNAVEAKNQRLRVLLAITDTALAHLTFDDLLPELLGRVRELMTVDNAAILLCSKDGQHLGIHAAVGFEEEVVNEISIPIGHGFAGRIAATRQPLIVTDSSSVEIINPLLREKILSLLGVPLLVADRVVGVIHIGTAYHRRFTEDDVQLLQRVADRIALAIECTRLYKAEHHIRTEATARASQLEAIFEAVTDELYVYDAQGRPKHMNSAARELLGLDKLFDDTAYASRSFHERGSLLVMRDELGQPLAEEQWPLCRVLKGEVLKGQNSPDLIFRTLNGREVQVSFSGAPMYDQDRRIVGAVVICRDVTKRRSLERRTRDALDALLSMAEALVQVPGSIDHLERVSGTLSATDLVGRRMVELTQHVLGCKRICMMAVEPETQRVHPVAVCGLSPELERELFARTKGAYLIDLLVDATLRSRLEAKELLLIDKRQPPFSDVPNPFGITVMLIAPICVGNQLAGVLYSDYGGEEHEYTPEELALIRAMTRLAALVFEREQAEIEHARAAALSIVNEQLGHASKMQSNFVAIVSHEFRTTLTGIQGFSELMRDEDFSLKEIKEYAADINTDAQRLHRMISELLDLDRMKSGRVTLNLGQIDLNTLIRDLVDHASQTTPDHTFRLQLDARLPLLSGDPDKLTQVITNLLSNAVKYSPAGGEIILTSQYEGDLAHVCVHDHGIGIPAHALERIFDPYDRIESATNRHITGTGLGLPIVRQIVQMHGGQVWAESILGQGSTFHFTLPLSDVTTTREDS